MKKTYRYRIKDKHRAALNKQARAVNFVWNYCNDAQKHALKWGKLWPSTYTLQKMTSGTSKELGINSDSIGKVCERYARSRQQFKKPALRYRGTKTLGWVPLKGSAIRIVGDDFKYAGKTYSVWLSRRVPLGSKICDGSSFSQDSRGRWYINLVLHIEAKETIAHGAVGIDLGLKDFATFSNGEKISAPQFYRKSQQKLATAQQARKKRQVTAIRAKAANQRRDFHHKISSKLVTENSLIVIGNINAPRLAKTRLAKSVLDAGWGSFRRILAYKSAYAGVKYIEVNEAFTTQMCSSCGAIGGPKGREQLCVREWQCSCGAVLDRDVNSALNILRLGHETLAGAAQ